MDFTGLKRIAWLVFLAWLSVLVFAIFAGGYSEYARNGNFGPLSAAIGVAIEYSLFYFIWKNNERVSAFFENFPLKGAAKFVLLGVLASFFVEILHYYGFMYPQGKTLLGDFVLTGPVYVALFGAWWLLSRKYHYSWKQAAALFGLNGVFIELFLGFQVFSNPAMLVQFPGHFANYAAIMGFVAFACKKDLEEGGKAEDAEKFVFGLLAPSALVFLLASPFTPIVQIVFFLLAQVLPLTF